MKKNKGIIKLIFANKYWNTMIFNKEPDYKTLMIELFYEIYYSLIEVLDKYEAVQASKWILSIFEKDKEICKILNHLEKIFKNYNLIENSILNSIMDSYRQYKTFTMKPIDYVNDLNISILKVLSNHV